MAKPRVPFAEVIGDPVDHSLSPDIHNHWLERLGLKGDYRRLRCSPAELPAYLARRIQDPWWRGCSVTMPLKEAAADLVAGSAVGAVNCVVPDGERLRAFNTDVEGVAAALGDLRLAGAPAVVIGAGGAARAVVAQLAGRDARVTILARSPEKAELLRQIGDISILPLAQAEKATRGAAVIVNATPLGMTGGEAMPPCILDALAAAPDALAVDMVYCPLVTPLLARAAAAGLHTADGLTILIGQARRQFELFFGAALPEDDAELRALLVRQLRAD